MWYPSRGQPYFTLSWAIKRRFLHECSPSKQLSHGHSRRDTIPRPNPARLWEVKNSCKSVHQLLAHENSIDDSTPASQPSYGKYRTRAKVFTKYPLLGTARITSHLRPDRAMGNAELVKKCSIEHSRQKTVNIVLFKAHEKRDRKTRQGNSRGYDNCRHNP